jgi:hypothetical protein
MNSKLYLTLDEKQQNFKPTSENKTLYGEVNTPYSLINEMLDLIETENNDAFSNPNLKWLDPACGCGYYAHVLYVRLMKGLCDTIKPPTKRRKHILENMIYMCEINPENIKQIHSTFNYKNTTLNLINLDFLSTNKEIFFQKQHQKDKQSHDIQYFDYIIGNPPYNANGLKKVPTLKNRSKKQDGHTVWDAFVKHSCGLLRPDSGKLCFIIPSIWMKPDKADNYYYFMNQNLLYIKTFDNTETKKLFKGQAQTPTCYFLMSLNDKKKSTSREKPEIKTNENQIIEASDKCQKTIYLFDSLYNDFFLYNHVSPKPIPLDFSCIFDKINHYTSQPEIGSLSTMVEKTNMPSSKISLQYEADISHNFINIHTCKLDGLTPYLEHRYSNKPCAYHNVGKIVLAHKMYGFPYYDKSGMYGICNRDSYVITEEHLKKYTPEEIELLCDFLGSDLAILLYEATRYRMKYLERYIFELLPNIIEMNRIFSIFDTKNREKYNNKSFLTAMNIPEVIQEQLINLIKKRVKPYKKFVFGI